MSRLAEVARLSKIEQAAQTFLDALSKRDTDQMIGYPYKESNDLAEALEAG